MAVTLLMSCASSPKQTANSNSQPHAAKKIDESDKPPFIGMTREQALARYGEPARRTVTPDGEMWTYNLNMGEFVGKHMIPFFFSTQELRLGILTFGPNGRVTQFRWDQPNP